MEARRQRGLEIAALSKVFELGGSWYVPSQSAAKNYVVEYDREHPTCTCPDFELRGCKCKHIFAVEFTIKRESDGNGKVTETRTVTLTEKRVSYPQCWPAYNAAQMNEKDDFQVLLFDLCKGIADPPQPMGRRRLPLRDMIFAATFKVFSTVSGRRFTSDLRAAFERGYLSKLPCYNSIFNYLESPDLTPILRQLIMEASRPLAVVEQDFAADSTGFSTSRYARWFDYKYGRVMQEQEWVKVHIMTGVKTNTITAVEIHGPSANDAAQFPALMKATAANFEVREVSADKAYPSQDNFNAIAQAGATPYIAFKRSTTGAVGGAFQKAYHYFCFNREMFLQHYHKRSNVESTFWMVKSKFSDHVRSKTDVAMVNEVLCKLLCHNLCCLIQAFYELMIEPNFWARETPAQNVHSIT